MTQWLSFFTNPVVYFFSVTCLLVGLYVMYEINNLAVLWALILSNSLFSVGLYMAIGVINQMRHREIDPSGGESQLYQVFDHDEAIVVQLGSNLTGLTRKSNDLVRLLSGVRHHLAEKYGFVVPLIEVEFNRNLGAQTVQLVVRQEILQQFELYPDCLAIPVTDTLAASSALSDRIGTQQYVWTLESEVNLADKTHALTAIEFLFEKVEAVLLDMAPVVLTRTDALKLMAIVRQQDPGIFHDLFELNHLNAGTFRSILGELLQRRISIRNISQVCDTLLRGDTGISQLMRRDMQGVKG
jgi:flagellar biosynthesis component FlhA